MNVFENQYQVAYVTPDIARAAEILQRQHGMPAFAGLIDDAVIENVVWTPDGDRAIAMRAAVARFQHLTIELVEPVSGAIEIFTDMLLPGQPLRLHHLGMRCDDLDAMQAAHAREGRPVVMAGGFKSARFIYVDARTTLGHFLEYASAPPGYWQR